MWNSIIELFQNYMGTGLLIGWFLLSVIYLLWNEKRKQMRILFVYMPLILLLLFFNPLFAKVVYRLGDSEIYYRILWLIPMTVIIAYAGVLFYGKKKGRARILTAAVLAVLIIVSGNYVYDDVFFRKAENQYHVPTAVVDICDAIRVEGREVLALFPADMVQYVRQYDPTICMPYGREQTVDRWGYYNELYSIMEAEVVDAEKLSYLAKQQGPGETLGAGCHYIILPQTKAVKGSLLEQGYILFGSMDGYDIYQDPDVYIGF